MPSTRVVSGSYQRRLHIMRPIGSNAWFMHRALLVALVVALVVLPIGCGGKDPAAPDAPVAMIDAPEIDAPPDAPPVAPPLRNPVTLADADLARSALQLLGASVPGASMTSCNTCHSLTRQQLRNWRGLSDAALADCLIDVKVSSAASARDMLACLRAFPTMADSDFLATKLGIYSSAVHLPWFEFTAARGHGAIDGPKVLAELVTAAAMPRTASSAVALTQPQFDVVAEWFARGLPRLEETLPPDPPPSACQPAVSIEVGTHVTAMKTAGWRALNQTSMMAMFGCGAATDPKLCLQTVPLGSAQPYGTGWDVPGRGKLRILADVTYASSFWTRSSPDGRFIGHGVQSVAGSYVIDLQRGGMLVPVNAAYDPNWFPDNSGFVFQGGPRNTCGQSVLTSNPAQVAMTEPACTSLTSIGLYQHVGAVSGGDHFAVDSRFVSDDGGHGPTLRDPYANFSSTAQLGVIPLVFDGSKFSAKPQVSIATPFEGDSVLSPSAKLVVSRVAGPNDVQLGYVLRKVVSKIVGSTYEIQVPEVARYCVNGGKPGFSYDERWMVYHHYVTNTNADAVALGFTGATDPGFQPYKTQGAANIYLLELATGTAVRITNMRPGQYALFPHFRSDGWIYAAVRDTVADHEYMVASDAALIAEQ
jgi:hypothetical protein